MSLRETVPSRRFLTVLAGITVVVLAAVVISFWNRFGVSNLRAYTEQTVFFQGEALRLPPQLAGPGEIRVVHFWDPGCPCHRETDAHLNYLISMYRFTGMQFYSVQRPGSEGEMMPFLKGKLTALPGLEGMESIPASPAIAIWDKQGQLAYAGPYSEGLVCNSANSFVEPVLDALVAGREVSSTNTMAVGCYCNWAGRSSS